MARDMKVMLTIGLKDLVTKGLDGIHKKLQTFEGRMTVIGGGMTAVGGAITGGFMAAAKSAAKFGSEISDMAVRTGMSAEALSALQYAAGQTGADISNVQMGVKTLSTQALQSLTSSTSQSALAFRQLGVKVTDASGKLRPTQDLFVEIGNKLRNVKNETERTALATQLLGRGGMMLMPMFADGAKSLGDFMAEAKALGLTIDDKTATALDDLDDSLVRVKMQTGVMTRILATVAVPVLLSMTQSVSKLLASVSRWTNAHPSLTKAILGTVMVLGMVSSALGPVLMALPGAIALWDRLSAALTRNAAAATDAAAANSGAGAAAAGGGAAAGAGGAAGLGGRLLGGLKGAGGAVKAAGAYLLSIVTGSIGAATAVVVGGAAILTALWAGIEAAFAGAWKRIQSTAGRAALAVSATIGFMVSALVNPVGAITAAGNIIRKHWQAIGEAVKGGLDSVREWFAGLWQHIAEMPGEFYRAGVGMVQALIDGLKARWAALKSEFSKGLQALSDMLPHSEPKSGPLRGLTKSGAALAGQFGKGISAGASGLQNQWAATLRGMTDQQLEAVQNVQYNLSDAQVEAWDKELARRGYKTDAAPESALPSSSGSVGTVYMTLNFYGISQPGQVAKVVRQELRAMTSDIRYGYPAGAGV